MSFRKQLVIIGFYALITFCALNNPIAHMATDVPGTSPVDFYHFHWNYWWIRHALTTPGLNIYITNYNMAPFVSNLAYHTLAVFWFPIWALLEPLFGTLVAMMAVMVVAVTLAGYSFFWLLRREGAALGLALVGGVMLQLMPVFLDAIALNDINMLGWFWLPTLLLLWGKIVQAVRSQARLSTELRWAVALAVVLWGMVMTDLQYPVFAAFLIVPYGLWTLWRGGERLRLLRTAALALGLALVLLWFIGPLPYMLSFDTAGLAFTPADQAIALDFPSGYVYQMVENTPVGYLAVPLLLLALAVSLLPNRWRSNPAQPVAKTATVPRGFWLALVPLPLMLAVGSVTPVYLAFHQLFGGMFRYPERFQPVFLIPAVLFAMLTLTPLVRRAPAASTIALLLVTLGWANFYHPMPTQSAPPSYAFYEAMGREPYDYVIVDVPTGGSSGQGIVGEPKFITTLFYALTHHKRVTNGHISRVNTWEYMYMNTSDPLMSWLGQRRLLDPSLVEAELRDHIFNYPIGYFVIHRRFIDPSRYPTVVDEIASYFNTLPDLLCPYTMEQDAIVYRTTWHPDGCARADGSSPRALPEVEPGVYQLDIGADPDGFYIGTGWHWQETVGGISVRWMGGAAETSLYVDLPPSSYTMTFRAQSYSEPRTVQIRVNGHSVGDALTVTPDALHDYSVTIPQEQIGDGQNVTVSFAYDNALVPAEIGQGQDQRALAVMVDTIRFAQIGS